MARSKIYVGVDVGATKTVAALVDSSGNVLARNRGPTARDRTAEDTFSAILEIVEELLRKEGFKAKHLAAIGLAIPGVVDPRRGSVVLTPNMNLSGVQVVGPMQDRFGTTVVLGNDANLGTLGESWLGAARNARNVVGVFWGTGIGGGVIVNGELLAGSREVAGEIGHMVMRINGPLCGCGNRGCLEALAGRAAIERDIRKAQAAGQPTIQADPHAEGKWEIKSKTIRRALDQGDEVVTRIMTKACEKVGYACLTLRHVLDPEVIVLGGGVIEACGDFAMPIIHKIVGGDTLSGTLAAGRVVESQLGDDAVLLGAVALARNTRRGARVGAEAGREPHYPSIEHVAPGEIVVGKNRYERDIYIRGNGKVRKRDRKAAEAPNGGSRKIDVEELKRVCKGNPERLIIGVGHGEIVKVTRDGKRFLRRHGIGWELLPSQEAATAFNDARGRKAALMHVTT